MMGWNNCDFQTTKAARCAAKMPVAQFDCAMASSYDQMND
jgi:hypothetical protein